MRLKETEQQIRKRRMEEDEVQRIRDEKRMLFRKKVEEIYLKKDT